MARMHDIPGWYSNPNEDFCAEELEDQEETISSGEGECQNQQLSPLLMTDDESALFDCLAKEVVDISGTDIDYYVLDLQRSVRDAVYDEPEERCWDGPYQLRAHVTLNDRSPEAREEGLVWTFSMEAWIARKEVEDQHMPRPKEGDVLRIWNVPFFDQFGSGNSTIDGAGFYFDVIRVETDGHLFDGPTFTGFKCELKRTTVFAAERKVFGDGVQRVT